MGIMAINTEKISPLPPLEVADPLAVNAGLPVSIDITVALTAKSVRFGKIDGFTIGKFQFIPIIAAVTIKAPSFLFRMVQFDGGMLILQLSLFCIHRQPCMAVTAGEYPLGEGRRSDRKFIVLRCRNG